VGCLNLALYLLFSGDNFPLRFDVNYNDEDLSILQYGVVSVVNFRRNQNSLTRLQLFINRQDVDSQNT